jgi:hypothetical protein
LPESGQALQAPLVFPLKGYHTLYGRRLLRCSIST